MRLWHEALIPYLPRQQLLGQHRECCALRGLGWGKKHATVNYVFRHPYGWLVEYQERVMAEMDGRGYYPDKLWRIPGYRGKKKEPLRGDEYSLEMSAYWDAKKRGTVYPEHNGEYLQECLENLERKGIHIEL